ncbi:uncharacterized protein F4807DRAFT_459794 [Annulohypoxylon truncatum]|uniref:uncharacterized protein n=1 Tax=Annulohypoxylon truncatum TaxID=327061 RepID=UPI002008927D|nr:uncharacterized protein F4807DRAFT_459794 [Annulohypoxylon truncatum]KAI1210416.1 hypothetical protein F4807DRAFT_459794 [Annulohypoxylon truncatum]
MASLLLHRNGAPSSVPSPPPLAGTVIGVILFTSAISILSWLLTQRSLAVKTWWHLPPIAWLVFTLYVDSWTFVFATGIINYGIGIDSNEGVCSAAILSYLFCYMSTKLIYMFLVEKAVGILTSPLNTRPRRLTTETQFIIRGGPKRRLESKMYLFNSFGILTIYGIMSILNFVYRNARLEKGRCVIGIGRQGLIPLISLDIVVMVYLTILFLNPLQGQKPHSYEAVPADSLTVRSLGIPAFQSISAAPASPRLRNVAMRTFVGALCTTTSTVINLIVLMVLDGEPGWVFLTCCNADILFSALVIQWVTRHDTTSSCFTSPDKHTSYRPAPAPAAPPAPPPRRNTKKLAISLPLKTTSTSQYEHIFGDPDPPDPPPSASVARSDSGIGTGTGTSNHKLESTSLDEPDDATILTPIPKPIPVAIDLGGHTDTPISPTRSPIHSPSHSRSRSRKPPKDRDRDRDHDPDRSWLTTLTRAHAQALITDRDLVPLPLSPAKPSDSSSPSSPPTVSAAVAADLERIRRYRDRRAPTSPPPPPPPPPTVPPLRALPFTSAPNSATTSTSASASASTPTSPTTTLTRTPTRTTTPAGAGARVSVSRGVSRTRSSARGAPGSASQYRISELAFEGDEEELPWHDLVVMEEGDGDRTDLGGWI